MSQVGEDEVTIRSAVPKDAAAIAAVHVRSWQQAYSGIVPAEVLDSLDADERARLWSVRLSTAAADHVTTWVALRGTALLGFASVGNARDEDARPGEREIYSIYLDPQEWGAGVARELIRTVVAELGERTPVSLWVLADNERARRFYRRHGFSPDGVERFEPFGGAQLLEVRYRRG